VLRTRHPNLDRPLYLPTRPVDDPIFLTLADQTRLTLQVEGDSGLDSLKNSGAKVEISTEKSVLPVNLMNQACKLWHPRQEVTGSSPALGAPAEAVPSHRGPEAS